MGRVGHFLKSWESYWSLGLLIAGSSSFALLTAFAAAWTDWMSSWGPIAWLATGALAFMVATLCMMGWSYARSKLVQTEIERQFFSRPDAVNPLVSEYRNQRIRLIDLVSPIDPIITGKRFIECEIIGPANVILLNNPIRSGSIIDCHLTNVNAVMIKDNIPLGNVIGLEGCHFTTCKIHQIMFFFPESAYSWASSTLPGLDWITDTP